MRTCTGGLIYAREMGRRARDEVTSAGASRERSRAETACARRAAVAACAEWRKSYTQVLWIRARSLVDICPLVTRRVIDLPVTLMLNFLGFERHQSDSRHSIRARTYH